MKYTEKEIRKLAHLQAQKIHLKGLFLGSTAFIVLQGLVALTGGLNLWVYIPVCILFLSMQVGFYMASYRVAKAIIMHELK